MERLRALDVRQVVGCAFIFAMMVAPFIALIYGFGFALAVLTLALTLTAVLAFDARYQVEPSRRKTALLMAGIAFTLALVTGIAAIAQFRS